MAATTTKFRNAILCDDIRDETGGRNSLMGVLGGDIVVPTLPGAINIAFYLQYFADEADGTRVSMQLRIIQDDTEVAKFGLEGDLSRGPLVTLILPRGVITFDKEGTLKMVAAVNGGPEEEVLNRKVLQARASSSASAPLASQSEPASKPKATT